MQSPASAGPKIPWPHFASHKENPVLEGQHFIVVGEPGNVILQDNALERAVIVAIWAHIAPQNVRPHEIASHCFQRAPCFTRAEAAFPGRGFTEFGFRTDQLHAAAAETGDILQYDGVTDRIEIKLGELHYVASRRRFDPAQAAV